MSLPGSSPGTLPHGQSVRCHLTVVTWRLKLAQTGSKQQGIRMDLQALARHAVVPLRRVRYVIDQEFLPRLPRRLQTHRAGRPRDLSAGDAFLVACAALLLHCGARRQTLMEML